MSKTKAADRIKQLEFDVEYAKHEARMWKRDLEEVSIRLQRELKTWLAIQATACRVARVLVRAVTGVTALGALAAAAYGAGHLVHNNTGDVGEYVVKGALALMGAALAAGVIYFVGLFCWGDL